MTNKIEKQFNSRIQLLLLYIEIKKLLKIFNFFGKKLLMPQLNGFVTIQDYI